MTSACPEASDVAGMLDGELPSERMDELEQHIEGCDRCKALAGELVALAEDEAAPAQFGRFRLERRLGAGAMGVVWAAWDPDLERRVALKRIHPEHTDGEVARARLIREARALARVSHPNVIAVYDVGEADGELFIATELVEGDTLTWRLADHSWREIVLAWAQAARGLAAAHAEGLVHRDVKPSNVLVGRDGRIRVGDFGLARIGASELATVDEAIAGPVAPALTATGHVAGTPAYMAPEQLAGGAIDARADQFALCVALVEALTGTRPAAGASPAVPGVPAAVASALVRGVAAEPAARFTKIDELAARLEHAAYPRSRRSVVVALAATALAAVAAIVAVARGAGAPAEARCDAAPVAAATWGASQRSAMLAAIAAVDPRATAAGNRLAAALDDWTASWVRTSDASCRATDRGEQSPPLLDLRAACLAHELDITRANVELASHADAELARHADDVARDLPRVDDCADTTGLLGLAPIPATAREAVAAVRRKLASIDALLSARRFKPALDAARVAAGDAARAGYPPVLAEADVGLGRAELALDDGNAAAAALWGALAVDPTRGDLLMTRCWLALTEVAQAEHLPEAAAQYARIAETLARKTARTEALRAELDDAIGYALNRADADADAIPYFERARPVFERTHDDSKLLLVLEHEVSSQIEVQGDYLAMVHAMLDLANKHPGDPLYIRGLVMGSVALGRADKLDEAKRVIDQALAAASRLDDDPQLAMWLHQSAAELAVSRKDNAGAIAEFRAQLAVAEAVTPPDDDDLFQINGWLGQSLYLDKDYHAAIPYLTKAYQLAGHLRDDVLYGPSLIHPPDLLDDLAGAHFHLGELDAARAEAEQQVALVELHAGMTPDDRAQAYETLATILFAVGDRVHGRAQLQRAIDARRAAGETAEVERDLARLAK